MLSKIVKNDIVELLKTCQFGELCDKYFSDNFLWVIKGSSVLSGTYNNKEEFLAKVISRLSSLIATGWKMNITNTYLDNEQRILIIEMQGVAKTITGGDYNNEYCWILQFDENYNKVIKLTAYYDSLLVNQTLVDADSLHHNDNSHIAIVHKDEGTSFWQPKNANGYVTVKISPWNIPNAKNTIFFQELPPGGVVSTHYHDSDDETFVCLSGEGIITIDGVDHRLCPHTIAYVGRKTKHSLQAIGQNPLQIMVSVSAPGLEERFKQMGRPRSPGEIPPPPFESGAPFESSGVKRS